MLSERLQQVPSKSTAQPVMLVGWFSWSMVILSAWFLGGLYLDGWAHSHGRVDNTFFTPWHAVFYSGFSAVTLLLGFAVVRGILSGHAWHSALPRGYELALVGTPLFALGGVGDLIWHTVFGIEDGIDALLSPTHLILAASMALILSAPARAAWLATDAGRSQSAASAGQGTSQISARIPIPALISVVFTLSLVTFMTQFGHPYVYILARTGYDDTRQALGVSAIMLQSALLIGFVLMMLRRWRLPFGSLTFMIGLNAALMNVIEDRYWVIGVGLAAGLLSDILLALLRPSPARLWALRLYALAIPALLYLIYFLTLIRIDRVVWSIHLWMGTVVMAGLVGLGMSLLICRNADGVARVELE